MVQAKFSPVPTLQQAWLYWKLPDPSTPQDLIACSYSISGLEPNKHLASAVLTTLHFCPIASPQKFILFLAQIVFSIF